MKKLNLFVAGILVFGLTLSAGAATDAVLSSSATYKSKPRAHVLKFKRSDSKGQILKPGEKAPTTTLEKSDKEMAAPAVAPSSAPVILPSALPKN